MVPCPSERPSWGSVPMQYGRPRRPAPEAVLLSFGDLGCHCLRLGARSSSRHDRSHPLVADGPAPPATSSLLRQLMDQCGPAH
jgi:hypothetical protein